jgi:hypothetical protein
VEAGGYSGGTIRGAVMTVNRFRAHRVSLDSSQGTSGSPKYPSHNGFAVVLAKAKRNVILAFTRGYEGRDTS